MCFLQLEHHWKHLNPPKRTLLTKCSEHYFFFVTPAPSERAWNLVKKAGPPFPFSIWKNFWRRNFRKRTFSPSLARTLRPGNGDKHLGFIESGMVGWPKWGELQVGECQEIYYMSIKYRMSRNIICQEIFGEKSDPPPQIKNTHIWLGATPHSYRFFRRQQHPNPIFCNFCVPLKL